MAISFPTGLDSLTRYVDGTTVFISATQNNMQLAIEALEVKVGINSSAVTASHDYKIATLEASGFGDVTTLDSDANTLLKAHAYLVSQDGIVNVYTALGTAENLKGYNGSTTDPVGAGLLMAFEGTANITAVVSMAFPVKSGRYWEITSDAAAPTIIWQPTQKTGTSPVDQD